MKIASLLGIFTLGALTTNALLIPSDVSAVARRSEDAIEQKRDTSYIKDLFKRKGGGGGGKGGGSSSSSSSSGGSSSSSSGSSRGSNAGGATSAGSGVRPAYGGGKYYGGGAAVPYTAGSKSPKGIAPVAILGVGALAFFPGLWLYGAYMYPYGHNYNFYNSTTRRNQTKPVRCLFQQYSVCGCDDNEDDSYLSGIIGNGSTAALNQTLVRAATVNGTDTLFLNGTLPNGTTASGGTDSTSAAGLNSRSVENMGWLVMGGAVAIAMAML